MKYRSSFQVTDPESFKKKLSYWLNRYDTYCLLDSNNYPYYRYANWDLIAGAGESFSWQPAKGAHNDVFTRIKQIHQQQQPEILFCSITYESWKTWMPLPAAAEQRAKFDGIGWPTAHVFIPEIYFRLKSGILEIMSDDLPPQNIWSEIQRTKPGGEEMAALTEPVKARMTRKEYLELVERVKNDILEGTYYELNLCQEFYTSAKSLSAIPLFIRYNHVTQAPFAALYRCGNRWLICGSPERFLLHRDGVLVSQPIKGTAPRMVGNPAKDRYYRYKLYYDPKERAENVMIVDLVRNDLSRSALPCTVEVEELFGIYPFEQVYQMISTVTAKRNPEIHPVDAIKYAFPMGSMTGAPKLAVMEAIERYEPTRRGLYSGTVGYITRNGDFDFNVVIRSLLYNSENHYLSYHTGGAITFDSSGEREYEECLLKAKSLSGLLK